VAAAATAASILAIGSSISLTIIKMTRAATAVDRVEAASMAVPALIPTDGIPFPVQTLPGHPVALTADPTLAREVPAERANRVVAVSA